MSIFPHKMDHTWQCIVVHASMYSTSLLLFAFFKILIFLLSEGRNRKLQGLAAAILKLWEKSLIAKIAVKFGVPNTNNEQMAYELKASLREYMHIHDIHYFLKTFLMRIGIG